MCDNCKDNCNCKEEVAGYPLKQCMSCLHASVCAYIPMLVEMEEVLPIEFYESSCLEHISTIMLGEDSEEEEQVGDCINSAGEPKNLKISDNFTMDQVAAFPVSREIKPPILYNALKSSTFVLMEQGFKPVKVMLNSSTAHKLLVEVHKGKVSPELVLKTISLPNCVLEAIISEKVPEDNFQIMCLGSL